MPIGAAGYGLSPIIPFQSIQLKDCAIDLIRIRESRPFVTRAQYTDFGVGLVQGCTGGGTGRFVR